ncbi:MAG: hypothetical protein Q8909_06965 [Bacteroidota bacterium]|nr:hypothetical protein [Bacteroidota bacterium]
MTNKETNELMMMESVDALLIKRMEIIMGKQSIVSAHQQLKQVITDVRSLRQTQSKSTIQESVNKSQLSEQVINGIKKIRTGILAHAASIDSSDFAIIENIKPATLDRIRKSKLVDISRLVYETALTIAPALEEWDVTQADIDDLGTKYPAYNKSISDARTQQSEVSTASDNIHERILDGKILLKDKLDRMIAPFETSNPNFYKEYQSARQVLDLGGSHSSTTDTPNAPQA